MVTYWVRARINSSTESLQGNSVGTKGEYTPYKIIEDNDDEEDFLIFSLSPNYPNPFNPTTKITYQLPRKGQVLLKIYNTLGKEVIELVNKTKEKGTYSVTFNAENLPSGMYFYRISVSDPSTSSGQGFTDVKKMLLLK